MLYTPDPVELVLGEMGKLADSLDDSMNVEGMGKLVGRIGELLVEQQLLERGWHPVRLDTSQMASNADLLAIKDKYRVSLQVKTTNVKSRHSHSQSLSFGYATGYLRDGKPIFNSKPPPLVADVVVGVGYDSPPRFVVMPVAFAEKLCRKHCDYWFKVRKTSGEIRSASFPIYLRFAAASGAHARHNEKMKRNLLAFEDRWDLLSEPVDRLHNKTVWSLK